MRAAWSRHLSGICWVCLVAMSCDDAETSKPNDQLVVSGQGGVAAAGRAGVGNGPTAGFGTVITAGTSAPTLGAAGTAVQPTAGTAGAPPISGNAGQAGTAIAGAPSQAGAGGVGGSSNGGAGGAAGSTGGAAGAAGTGTTTPAGDPCAMTPFPIDGTDAPSVYVNGGVPVNGAGCKQMWEGIVMTVGGRGLCTAAFISDRHLISASHCYARDGAVSVDVSAPSWENGAKHTFQAQVKRSGSNMSLDISIIDLGKPVEWATPARRFVLHAGKVSGSVDMHLYGFGSGGSSGAAGKLRGIPNRATISVTDNGRGNLNGKAGEAQLCQGDSGGPAFVEKTAAVLYGINQAIVPASSAGGRTCAGPDWTIMFTNVSEYMSFIEMAVGKTCERKKVDDLDVAQCW